MPNLYFIRHGESTANVQRIFDNETGNYPLTEIGIQQSTITADWFASQPIDLIYTSPIPRAVQTAQIIANRMNLPFKIVPEFKEFRIGDLEGQPMAGSARTIFDTVLNQWMQGDNQASFPHGENYDQLIQRFKLGINQIISKHPNKDLLVVTHGGLLIFGIKALCPQLDWSVFLAERINHCSITTLNVSMQKNIFSFQLMEWANSKHLPAHLVKSNLMD